MRTFVKSHKKNDSWTSNSSDGYADVLRSPGSTKSNEQVFNGGSPNQGQRGKYSGAGSNQVGNHSSPKKLLSPIKNLFGHHGGKGSAGAMGEYPGYLNEKYWDVRTMRHVGEDKETPTIEPVRAVGVKTFGGNLPTVAPKIRVDGIGGRTRPKDVEPATRVNAVSLSNAVNQNGLVVKPGPRLTAVVESGHVAKEGNVSRFSNSSQLDSSVSLTSSVSPRDEPSSSESFDITKSTQMDDEPKEADADYDNDDDYVSDASSNFSFTKNIKGGRSTSVKYYKKQNSDAYAANDLAVPGGVFNENDLDYEIEEYPDYDFDNNGMDELEDEDDFGGAQYSSLFSSEENIAGDVGHQDIHGSGRNTLVTSEEQSQSSATQHFSSQNATLESLQDDKVNFVVPPKDEKQVENTDQATDHFSAPPPSLTETQQFHIGESRSSSNEDLHSPHVQQLTINGLTIDSIVEGRLSPQKSLNSTGTKDYTGDSNALSLMASNEINKLAIVDTDPEVDEKGTYDSLILNYFENLTSTDTVGKTTESGSKSEFSFGTNDVSDVEFDSGKDVAGQSTTSINEFTDSKHSNMNLVDQSITDPKDEISNDFEANNLTEVVKQGVPHNSNNGTRPINPSNTKPDPNKRKSVNQMMATLERLDFLQSNESFSNDVIPLDDTTEKSTIKPSSKKPPQTSLPNARKRYSWYNNDEKLDFKARPLSHVSVGSDDKNCFRESLEDAYNNESSVSYIDQDIIDEVNQLPEDYDYDFQTFAQRTQSSEKNRFNPVLPFNKKPIKAVNDSNFASNKIETLNKTVTIYRNNSTPKHEHKKKSIRRAYSDASRSSFISIADDIYSDSDDDYAYTPNDMEPAPSNPFSRSTYGMSTINEAETSSL